MDDRVDRSVAKVAEGRGRWSRTRAPERARLLRRAIAATLDAASTWTSTACSLQGIPEDTPLSGEVTISGPVVTVRGLRAVARTLEGRRALATGVRPDGSPTVRVFPDEWVDRWLYPGVRAEVVVERSPGPSTVRCLDRSDRPVGIAAVLGAGNITSISPLDLAHQWTIENRTTVLKPNPLLDPLTPVLERALAPFVERDMLAFVAGGAGVGRRLVDHPGVDAVHVTGSATTYDALVWGEDASRTRPRLDKPVTAELGAVTPVLVVPGAWSRADVERQALNVASMVTHNASFNCNAAKVVVTASGWERRDAFLEALRGALRRAPARAAYYPGATERYERFLAAYPSAEVLGRTEAVGSGATVDYPVVPWTFVPNVPPNPDELALREEAFCGLLAHVDVDAHDAGSFLDAAVALTDDAVHGTLSCVLLCDPATRRALGFLLERAIDRLRYGAVAVNAWTGVNFALGTTTWGAFPGHAPEAIGSGIGVVHNGAMLARPVKSIVYAPFRPWPKPVWFQDHRTLDRLARHVLRFEATRSVTAFVRTVAAALRA